MWRAVRKLIIRGLSILDKANSTKFTGYRDKECMM
jgi:hypothetical protein